MMDSTISTLRQPYTFYKISGLKQHLSYLVPLRKLGEEEHSQSWQSEVEMYYSNYLSPQQKPELAGRYAISKFYNEYLTLYNGIDPNQLKGIDRILYPHLRYPFRNTKLDLNQIQNTYNLNFFSPLYIPPEYPLIKCNKYNCDGIYYIPIDKLKNVDEDPNLGDYWSIMYDIENAVYIPSQHNNQPPTTILLNINREKPHSDLYVKFVCEFSKQDAEGFYDYNQIICISLIEQSFTNQIGKKIALINKNEDIPLPDNLLQLINYDYTINQQTNDYCDELIICKNERELLTRLIQILSNPKYHVIQHFNGWKFDERMIMSRMTLYGDLFEQYYHAMRSIRTQLPDSDQYMITFKGQYKINGSMATQTNLCQIRDPLKFSSDVYQINLHDDTESQKRDNNSLNALLDYYDLGLKGEVSYQELTDSYHNKQIDTLIKGYWYCQRDSIQQCKLQAHLQMILNYCQFSKICHIPLQQSMQNAVGSKIAGAKSYFTQLQGLPLLDVIPPYEVQDTFTNIGGEVKIFQKGFSKYVSAVDAASMYPAQIEANNISNDCLLYPQDMIYILTHPQEFNITNVKVSMVLDKYSPYNNSWNRIPLLDQNVSETIQEIFIPDRYPRYRIQINDLIYEQFFFNMKDMSPIYNYAFYLQGGPYSPMSKMLTTLRFLRKDVKKKMKQTTDPVLKSVYNALQGAIKIIMNGTYGQLATVFNFTYELLGASMVTYQARLIIQNCRDHLTRQHHIINERIYNDMQKPLQQYYDFIQRTITNPDELYFNFKGHEEMMQPLILMKYQDTDSNYFTMPCLERLIVKPEYTNDAHHIIMHIFGLYNDVFRAFINSLMNKFPLEFGFEGAFYRAWHIQKKMYLGQKSEQYVCEFKNDTLNILYHLADKIDLSSFDPENDDVNKYLIKHHIKVTGLQVIKRNTTMLLKKYYIRLIQETLNQSQDNIYEFIHQLIVELYNEFPSLPVKQFCEPKKMTKADTKQQFVIIYNSIHPEQQLGLGTVMNTIIIKPPALQQNQFHKDWFKINESKLIIARDQMDKKAIDFDAYMAYYIQSVTKNLLTFATAAEDDIDVEQLSKELLEKWQIVYFGWQVVDYNIDSYDKLTLFIQIYQQWIEQWKKEHIDTITYNMCKYDVTKIRKALQYFYNVNLYNPNPYIKNCINYLMNLFRQDQ